MLNLASKQDQSIKMTIYVLNSRFYHLFGMVIPGLHFSGQMRNDDRGLMQYIAEMTR